MTGMEIALFLLFLNLGVSLVLPTTLRSSLFDCLDASERLVLKLADRIEALEERED